MATQTGKQTDRKERTPSSGFAISLTCRAQQGNTGKAEMWFVASQAKYHKAEYGRVGLELRDDGVIS